MDTQTLVFALGILLVSVVLHELGHGYAALKLGDDTAKRMGRLSFNPIRHVDPFMTVILPLILYYSGGPIFGGAKPVPIDPNRFTSVSPRKGMMLVAAAGPLVNLALALVALGLIHLNYGDYSYWQYKEAPVFNQVLYPMLIINSLLMIFNLIPIPPLDGSRILTGLVSVEIARMIMGLEKFGLIIIMFIMFTGGFDPVMEFFFRFVNQLLPHVT